MLFLRETLSTQCKISFPNKIKFDLIHHWEQIISGVGNMGSKLFPLRLDTFSERRQNNVTELPSLKVYPCPFTKNADDFKWLVDHNNYLVARYPQ